MAADSCWLLCGTHLQTRYDGSLAGGMFTVPMHLSNPSYQAPEVIAVH